MAPTPNCSNNDNALIKSTVRVKIPTTMCNKKFKFTKKIKRVR